MKPEFSQALDSLLAEIETAADTKVLRATASHFRRTPTRHPSRPPQQSSASNKRPKSCPLCKQAGRNDLYYLSAYPFLSSEDRAYFTRSRLTTSLDGEAVLVPDAPPCPEPDDYDPILPTARIVSRRVSTNQSPRFKAFYKQMPLTLTLDTGAETSMIKLSTARSIGAPIEKSTQQALQADGVTPLTVIGETYLTLSRSNHHVILDALVVDDLDVNVLAGTPFLIANDITVRPAKCQIRVRDSETIVYTYSEARNSPSHVVRRAHSYVVRSTSPTSVVWPGEYFELDVLPDFGEDRTIAIEPHTPSSWPPPQILDTVGNKVRLVNSTDEPKVIQRHEHLCHALPTESTPYNCPPPPLKPNQSKPFSSTVSLDPDCLLSTEERHMFQQSLIDFDHVFDPKITGYNGAAGPTEATVNIGSVQPPQRKGRVP